MKSRESGVGKAVGRKQGKPPVMEKQAGGKQPSEAPDLSGMSFEERKALYKQKYNKGDKPAPQKQSRPQNPDSQKQPGGQPKCRRRNPRKKAYLRGC